MNHLLISKDELLSPAHLKIIQKNSDQLEFNLMRQEVSYPL